MARKAILFEVTNDAYCPEDVKRPYTVGELKEILEDFDDESLFILSFGGGYTYGRLCRDCYEDVLLDDDEE